jgi:hypothetical protein
MGLIGAIRFFDELSPWVQPPDAENHMSGIAGGMTGAISSPGSILALKNAL